MKIDPSANRAAAEPDTSPQPKRVLGFRDLVMFYVVATLSLRWIAVAASAGPSTVVIWLIGLATIFIPLALCVLELSSRYPQEGGMYVWSKRAFGDFAGFLTGWIYWTSNLPYFPAVLYFAASNALYVGGSKWKGLQGNAGFFMAFSLLGLGLALALNIIGLDIGKWLSNLGAIGTWLPIVLLFVAGVLVTAGYMLGTVAILVVLPHSQLNSLEGIMQAISSSAERVGWRGLGPAVALLICISNLGGVGAYLAALSRIPFVAGIDRFLPPAFGRVHPKWGTPYVSLIVQSLCCVLFIVLGQFGSTVHGAYQVLVSMTIITNFVPYLFMFAAMVRLQREPVEVGVVRVPGGKPVAIALATVGFVTTCAVILGSMVPDASEPNKALAVGKIIALSALLLGGGVVLYWLGKRTARVSSAD